MRYLLLAFAICLACSSLGFIRVVYFVGLGYAASIATQAVAAGVSYSATLTGWPLVQLVLLLGYGIRLGSYLVLRDADPGYRNRDALRHATPSRVGGLQKIAVWIGVAALYVLMARPAFLTLSAQAQGLLPWSLPFGVAMMAAGLALESLADWQKFRFKAAHPMSFCNTGLYRVVRSPNYLGEMIFWLGLWYSAASVYRGWLDWTLCSVGLACILGIMIGATRRLEKEQGTRYAANAAYASYVRTVPVLIPFLPLYSLRGAAVTLP